MIMEITVLLGITIILFAGWGGGLNVGNLVVGLFLIVVGVFVAFDGAPDVSLQRNGTNEVTHSSKEKNTNGNHVTIDEEITTRKVTNQSREAI